MDAIFDKEYVLRTLDFDRYNRIKPSAVLDLFQDAAGFHTMQFGCDRFSMRARDLYWVLVNVKMEFLGNIMPTETLVIRTWPIKSNGVKYYRGYKAINEKGEVVIVAQSCWTMIDAKTKRIAVNEKTYPDDFDYCDELPFGKKIIKISDFETSDVARSLEPRFSDLDYNGHVNNAKYADFVLDTLVPREGIKLKSFQIDYHKEIKPEETVSLHTFSKGDNVKLKGIGDDGAVRFIAEVGYEK